MGHVPYCWTYCYVELPEATLLNNNKSSGASETPPASRGWIPPRRWKYLADWRLKPVGSRGVLFFTPKVSRNHFQTTSSWGCACCSSYISDSCTPMQSIANLVGPRPRPFPFPIPPPSLETSRESLEIDRNLAELGSQFTNCLVVSTFPWTICKQSRHFRTTIIIIIPNMFVWNHQPTQNSAIDFWVIPPSIVTLLQCVVQPVRVKRVQNRKWD